MSSFLPLHNAKKDLLFLRGFCLTSETYNGFPNVHTKMKCHDHSIEKRIIHEAHENK